MMGSTPFGIGTIRSSTVFLRQLKLKFGKPIIDLMASLLILIDGRFCPLFSLANSINLFLLLNSDIDEFEQNLCLSDKY